MNGSMITGQGVNGVLIITNLPVPSSLKEDSKHDFRGTLYFLVSEKFESFSRILKGDERSEDPIVLVIGRTLGHGVTSTEDIRNQRSREGCLRLRTILVRRRRWRWIDYYSSGDIEVRLKGDFTFYVNTC